MAEVTCTNWGAPNKGSLSTTQQRYIDLAKRWYFNGFDDEPLSLKAKR